MTTNFIYDIRTPELAKRTLELLVGNHDILNLIEKSTSSQCEEYLINCFKDKYNVENFFKNSKCIFVHYTTSDDCCETIKKYGLFNTLNSLTNVKSSLFTFLKNRNISIDIENKTIDYNNDKYPLAKTSRCVEEGNARLVRGARVKVTRDPNIQGFFYKLDEYSCLRKYPEILADIRAELMFNNINLPLLEDWQLDHKPYVVTCEVPMDWLEKSNPSEFIQKLIDSAITVARDFNRDSEILMALDTNIYNIPPKNIINVQNFDDYQASGGTN